MNSNITEWAESLIAEPQPAELSANQKFLAGNAYFADVKNAIASLLDELVGEYYDFDNLTVPFLKGDAIDFAIDGYAFEARIDGNGDLILTSGKHKFDTPTGRDDGRATAFIGYTTPLAFAIFWLTLDLVECAE